MSELARESAHKELVLSGWQFEVHGGHTLYLGGGSACSLYDAVGLVEQLVRVSPLVPGAPGSDYEITVRLRPVHEWVARPKKVSYSVKPSGPPPRRRRRLWRRG